MFCKELIQLLRAAPAHNRDYLRLQQATHNIDCSPNADHVQQSDVRA